MKAEYSRRALRDLEQAGRDSRAAFGPAVAQALEQPIREVVGRVEAAPLSARPVGARPGVRVVPLVKYPYKIFYEIMGETIEILHIRHAARRPWRGE